MTDVVVEAEILAASLAAGILGGLFGIGGGSIIVPILSADLGLPLHESVVVGLAASMLTGLSSNAHHYRMGIVDGEVAAYLAAAGVVGSWLGAHIALGTPERILALVFGATLMGLAVTRLAVGRRGRARERRWSLPIIGLAAGILAGALGLGGGIVNIPLVTLVAGIELRKAIGSNSLVVAATAASGLTVYISAAVVKPAVISAVALGVFAGTSLGSAILSRISGGILDKAFTLLLAYYGLRMLAKGFGG